MNGQSLEEYLIYKFKFNHDSNKDKTTQNMFNKQLNDKYMEIPLYFTRSGDIPLILNQKIGQMLENILGNFMMNSKDLKQLLKNLFF